MKFETTAIVHGVKESKGSIEGRAYSSTTFHIEVDLQENSSGRSIGTVTRPFKFGSADEFVGLLRQEFDLDLPQAATVWPAICAKHDELFGAGAPA